MQTQERLVFRYDFADPHMVKEFHPAFAAFLVRESSKEDAEAFIHLLSKYVDAVEMEDLNFGTIVNIAAQFADLEDTSGVPLEQNPLLQMDEADSAERVLELLDKEREEALERQAAAEDLERDTPVEVAPHYPEVEVQVEPDDDIPMVIYRAIVGLRKEGWRKAGSALAQDVRQALREDWTNIQFLRLVESYVMVDYEYAIDRLKARKRHLLRGPLAEPKEVPF